MEIKYKINEDDFEKVANEIFQDKINGVFKSDKKIKNIKYKVPLILFIIPLIATLLDGIRGFKETIGVTVAFYIVFVAIIILAYKILKGAMSKNLKGKALSILREGENGKVSEKITTGILSEEKLIIENEDTYKVYMMDYIEEVKTFEEYIYIKFLDDTFEIIPLRYFKDTYEISDFINLIERNRKNNKKLKITVKEKIINTINFKVTLENLITEHKFISNQEYYKELIKVSKICFLLFQLFLFAFVLVITYFFLEKLLLIVFIIFTLLILYTQFFTISKTLNKANEKSLKDKWVFGKEYNIDLNEEYIYIYSEYSMIKRRLNNKIASVDFNDYIIVTFDKIYILANIPKDAFNTLEDRNIFINKLNNK